MGLMGKGNRDKQQEILNARKAASKATNKVWSALRNKEAPKK